MIWIEMYTLLSFVSVYKILGLSIQFILISSVIMYTIFRRNIDYQCLTWLYLFLLQLGKQLFSFSPVTLEPLNYQLVVLCKKQSYIQDSWHLKASMFATVNCCARKEDALILSFPYEKWVNFDKVMDKDVYVETCSGVTNYREVWNLRWVNSSWIKNQSDNEG